MKDKKTLKTILAIIGGIIVVAGIAYAIYRFLTPDYLENYEDDYDEDFDDDFFEDEEVVKEADSEKKDEAEEKKEDAEA